MRIISVTYPAELRIVLQHAERFANLLLALPTPRQELSQAWLIGRVDEIETVLTSILGDWESGMLSIEAAAAAMASYVRALHVSAQEKLDLDPIPDCCIADVIATVPMTPPGDAARGSEAPTLLSENAISGDAPTVIPAKSKDPSDGAGR